MTNSEILNTMKLLGIKEITSPRQARNGTRAFELPMRYYSPYDSRWNYKVVLSSFKSGYVRKNCYDREYQINKVKSSPRKVNNSYTYQSYKRILIPNELDRLEYIVKFAVRNYYLKPQTKVRIEEKRVLQDISVIIDGEQHDIQTNETLKI